MLWSSSICFLSTAYVNPDFKYIDLLYMPKMYFRAIWWQHDPVSQSFLLWYLSVHSDLILSPTLPSRILVVPNNPNNDISSFGTMLQLPQD